MDQIVSPRLVPAKFRDPIRTAKGEPRATVGLRALDTLWFNTGTLCNLTCGNCYIESSPRNDRLAWLTAAAASIAILTLTGSATVAAALHRAYSLGWVAATVAAALLLTLPLSLEMRTVVALLCGPLVGIAVHLAALARADG